MPELVLGLLASVAVGGIGVAIMRGTPPGSFVIGALIFLFGAAAAAVGFVGAVVFLLAIAARVLS